MELWSPSKLHPTLWEGSTWPRFAPGPFFARRAVAGGQSASVTATTALPARHCKDTDEPRAAGLARPRHTRGGGRGAIIRGDQTTEWKFLAEDEEEAERIYLSLPRRHRPAFLRAMLAAINGMDLDRVEKMFWQETLLADIRKYVRQKANRGD